MPIAPDVYKKIVTAKLYMDERFHERIDLDRLSRQACLSRYHFHRLFRQIYRLTPHQYLTRKRIEAARKSLAVNRLTITEICNDVGFESIGLFSTLFKKEIGQAPRQLPKSGPAKTGTDAHAPPLFYPPLLYRGLHHKKQDRRSPA